jgi:two-component system, LuxR family, sensor kinase FixL
MSRRDEHDMLGNGSGIEIGRRAEFPDSFFIREMKDYRKMSRAELLSEIEQLKTHHASRAKHQRKQARTQVRDREERLRAILETAVEGIITIDERGIVESMNRAAEKIFGYSAREIIGKNVKVLMPSPHREQHDGYLANYRETGHAKIIGIGREVAGRRKDGTIFPMDLAVSEVQLADRRMFTGFIRDITERKQLEKQTLEISEREQRRIGHDLHDGLCQHLAGIELMSEVLGQNLSKRSKRDAKRVGEITKNVREAIGHTRSLARGLSPVTHEPDGLMTALRELGENTEKIFRVACRFECDPPLFIHDAAVASNLFRIAQEAVSNATKHGKAKRISITLESERGKILLRIRDNGIGFPATHAKSQGMGLRVMQSRAGMIGGTLAVEPATGGGVTVTCAVPLLAPAPKS